MMLHLQLKEQIETHFAAHLNKGVVMLQDALQLSLSNGVEAEIRYFNPVEYSLRWVWGAAESRIDTAPLHAGLETSPNHFHNMAGRVVSDPLTVHGGEPWNNVRTLLGALIQNPALDEAPSIKGRSAP